MKRAVIVYSSMYGHIERYATMISKLLNCDCYNIDVITLDKVKKYDILIYGGPVILQTVYGSNRILQALDELKDKDIVIYTCGILGPTEANTKIIIDNTFVDDELERLKFFHFPGGFNKEELTYGDFLIYRHMVNKAYDEPITGYYQKIKRATARDFDYVKEDYVLPLVNYVLDLQNKKS